MVQSSKEDQQTERLRLIIVEHPIQEDQQAKSRASKKDQQVKG